MWIYIDPNGDEQGPFPSSRVLRWEAKGYFDGNLQASAQAGGGDEVRLANKAARTLPIKLWLLSNHPLLIILIHC